MIKTKQDLKEWLSVEKKGYGIEQNSLYCLLRCAAGAEKYVIWHFQKRLRQTEYYHNSGKRILYYQSLIRLNRMSNKYCLHIGMNNCGKGLKIMHLGPVLMNGKTKIGENVSIHMNTSFVAQGTKNDAPTVGNGVVIGVGAVLVGGVHIADNVAVGANAVVTKDVEEENIAVAGVPAKKISDNGRLTWNKPEEK